MTLWLALTLLAAPAPPPITQLPADQLPPLPTCHVARAAKPPLIDGRLSPGEWDAAAPLTLTYPWPAQTGPKDRTTVRLLWDDACLYVAYECEDHDLTATHRLRDDPTYKDDCCEIFLQPEPRKPRCYVGLEMNAAAVMYDYAVVSREVLYRRFDLSGYLLATLLDGTLNQRGDDDHGFGLEVAVPFANFDDLTGALPPKPGATWRAQICRWNGTEPDRALSLWTHSGMKSPDPHNPERFGTLVFERAQG